MVLTLKPDDGLVIEYGDFLELSATFLLKNKEPTYAYSYGWIIKNLFESDVDLAYDAVKPYFNTPLTRAHLDYNIIAPNSYYNITFYVKGKE
jgi:hypothetical protein